MTKHYHDVYFHYTIKGGGNIPDIFKALASITAWTLFIASWVTALTTMVSSIAGGCMFGTEPPPMVVPVFYLVALAEAVSAVVVMILRKKME